MSTFEYTAAAADGALVHGRQWAADELALDRELEARGLTLFGARPLRRGGVPAGARLERADLHSLTTQLATVCSAGVRIVEGLESIGTRLKRPAARAVVESLVAQLRDGRSLSEAMEAHPKSFPDVYRASVRAGEASGALDVVLVRLAKYLEWSAGMRATAIQALIYPTILFHALVGLVLVLVYFVVPRIVKLFPMGRESLPAETRALLAVSDFLSAHWLALLVLGAALSGALAWALKRPEWRLRFHSLLLRIPRMGPLSARLASSRFASTASTLQAAGCEVFTVLSVSGSTCGNAAIRAGFERAAQAIQRGSTLTQALEREPHVDPLLVQMVSVGEQSGDLDGCLGKLAAYYDEEIPREVKRYLALLEPAMLLGAGLVVAFVLIAALLPLFDLYQQIG